MRNELPCFIFQAEFLSKRGLTECEFCQRFLESDAFSMFIEERGPPWRATDLWDELYASMSDERFHAPGAPHVREMSQLLYNNEHPSQSTFTSRIPRPTDGALQVSGAIFPKLDGRRVDSFIEEQLTRARR